MGNTSSSFSDSITYNSPDATAPTGIIKINNGAASTTSNYVQLTLLATDNAGGSGLDSMRFSNDGSRWGAWNTHSTAYYNWDMTALAYGGSTSKGTKRVYVQFKDKAGNVSTNYYDEILYQ